MAPHLGWGGYSFPLVCVGRGFKQQNKTEKQSRHTGNPC